MSSKSATVLVILTVAIVAFCLASVFASMTGPINILPNNTDIPDYSTDDDSDSYDYQSYDDNSYSSSSYSSDHSSSSSSDVEKKSYPSGDKDSGDQSKGKSGTCSTAS